MSVPEFTAEASLYRSQGRYRALTSFSPPTGLAHVAEMRYTYTGPSVLPYIDPSLFVGERDRPSLQRGTWKVVGCQLQWMGAPTGTRTECQTPSDPRPVSPLSECPGADKSGALCYPFCAEGYHGAGPYCWQNCPDGYTDDGATCRRDAQIISADTSQCPGYDVCGLTFARGCSTCPPGYANDGCTCRRDVHIFLKNSYWRGWGSPMSCHPGEQQIGGLCYGNCPAEKPVADGIDCKATYQVCHDVQEMEDADQSQLTRFCFAQYNPDSPYVEPCKGVWTMAVTEDQAKQILRCSCSNCSWRKVDCTAVDLDTACA
jgi:hypothetical protein